MSLLLRLVVLLALEGALLALLGVGYGVASATGSGERAPAELAAGGAVLGGVVLLLLARAVARRRSWSRSPAVVLNLLALPVALGAFQGGAWFVGVPLVLLAGAVLYLFATPPLRAAFREGA